MKIIVGHQCLTISSVFLNRTSFDQTTCLNNFIYLLVVRFECQNKSNMIRQVIRHGLIVISSSTESILQTVHAQYNAGASSWVMDVCWFF